MANSLHGEVWDIGYLGDFSVFIVKLADGRVIRAAQANVSRLVDRPITFGDMVWLNWYKNLRAHKPKCWITPSGWAATSPRPPAQSIMGKSRTALFTVKQAPARQKP